MYYKNRDYFDDMIKVEDFSFDNISLDEKLSKNIWFLKFHTKL